jgi:glycerol transport system ATP-binding protein
MLELRDVSRRVDGETHIESASLRLSRGEMNVLLGPTGAGKTTLMRLMAGLDRPSGGEIYYKNAEITDVPVRRRNVAMVYQQFINYPGWTVRENIASPLKARGLDGPAIGRAVGEAAELLRLTSLLDRTPLELSGGQQQRVALARAIVKKADIVLLDEPLANLDYKLREEMREELPRLFAGSGSVVVYATTEPTEALLLGGKTVTLHEGRVTQVGPTLDVYRRPENLMAARTFSDPPLNTLRVHASGGRTWPRDGDAATCRLRPLPDGAWTLAFRPHHLRLGEGPDRAMGFRLEVMSTEITGSESFVHMRLHDERWTMLTHGVKSYAPGAVLDAHVEPENVLTFDEEGLAVKLREAA